MVLILHCYRILILLENSKHNPMKSIFSCHCTSPSKKTPKMAVKSHKRGVWPPCTKHIFLKLTTHWSNTTLSLLLQKACFNKKIQAEPNETHLFLTSVPLFLEMKTAGKLNAPSQLKHENICFWLNYFQPDDGSKHLFQKTCCIAYYHSMHDACYILLQHLHHM